VSVSPAAPTSIIVSMADTLYGDTTTLVSTPPAANVACGKNASAKSVSPAASVWTSAPLPCGAPHTAGVGCVVRT